MQMAYVCEQEFILRFEIKKILKRNKNGYTFAQIKPLKVTNYPGKFPKQSNLSGNFPVVFTGDIYEAICVFKENPRVGYTIVIKKDLLFITPVNLKEISTFIHSKSHGVGKSLIESIVNRFKAESITVIREHPEMLKDIQGLTENKIKILQIAMKEQKYYEDILFFIQSMGLSSTIATKIYNDFDAESLLQVKKNPYTILKIEGIHFAEGDQIAKNLGWPYNEPRRIRSAVLSYLTSRNQQGDLCTVKEAILTELNHYLQKAGVYIDAPQLSDEEILNAIEHLLKKKTIVTTLNDGQEMIYRKSMAVIEDNIAAKLARFLREPVSSLCSTASINKFINDSQDESQSTSEQDQVLYAVAKNKLTVLTGGPGTGKTYTMARLVRCLRSCDPSLRICLTASTGRASARLSEVTKCESMTIHRKIGYGCEQQEPYKRSKKLIDEDLLIIDESTMIDVYIFNELCKHISDETHILLVGDVDQLPSVGPGMIFKELIDSKLFPVISLQKIFRQAQESQIVRNAHKILNNVHSYDPDGISFDTKKGDFYFIDAKSEEDCAEKLIEMAKRCIQRKGYSLLELAVLSPTKKGIVGTNELNPRLQEILNPKAIDKKEMIIDDFTAFRVGDKVIHTKNNKNIDVNNGDVGVITEINNDKIILYVKYPNKDFSICYQDDMLTELELAFAYTIHKSQGSEYPVVLMPILSSQSYMLNKNLLYTGITRAKQMVILIGDQKVFDSAIDKIESVSRKSCLINKIKNNLI